MEDESKDYVMINTHRGLFRCNPLPFGVLSAPGIFQHAMEALLQGIRNLVVYIDDILVTGTTEKVHLNTLNVGPKSSEKGRVALEGKQVPFYVTISGIFRAQN